MTDHHTFETQAGGILQCEICRHQYTVCQLSNHTSPLVPHLRQSNYQFTCTVPPPCCPIVPYHHQSNYQSCTILTPVHLYRTSTSPIVPHLHQSTSTVPPPVHLYRTSASPQVPQLGQSTGTATPPVHLCILCHSQILNPFKISSKRKRNNVVISF